MKPLFKPYQLVHCTVRDQQTENAAYTHIGQVMSMPMHDTGTIMVRRVPGFPGTLTEMKLADIAALPSHGYKPRFVHYAIVKGFGQFPVDMLRYDSACPLNFTLELDRWQQRTKPVLILDPDMGKDYIVCNVTHTRSGGGWTPDRWSSFLWGIKPIRCEAITE